MEFKDNLHMIRRDKGITQKELAKLAGVCHITISRYETGFMDPTLPTLRKIKKTLNCSYDQLIGE